MKPEVKCSCCGQMFRRELTDYVKTASTRYAHRKCAIEHGKNFIEDNAPDIKKGIAQEKKQDASMIAQYEAIIRSIPEQNRQAVLDEKQLMQQQMDQIDKEVYQFFEYLDIVFGKDGYSVTKAKNQAENFIRDYGFTYGEMLRILKWWYEVEGADPAEAFGGVGIIPFIQFQAKAYYDRIEKAHEKNEDVTMADLIQRTERLTIQSPRPYKPKRKEFNI